MPKYTITADDGMQFIGTPELIDNLPDEFAKQIKEQVIRASKGQSMEPVRVPRGLLEQAGWMSKEEYLLEQENQDEPTNSVYQASESKPQLRPQRVVPPPDMTMCEKCPFKETAMKLIEKTLRGLE